jgi:integrase
VARKRANGTGSISKRKDGLYVGRVTVGWEVVDGRRKQLRRAVYGRTIAEVQAKLIEVQAQHQAGTLAASRGRSITLNQYAARWLAGLEDHIKPRTHADYGSVLRVWVLPRIGSRPLNRLERKDVNEVTRAMKQAGLGPRRINYCRSLLRALLREAQREELIGRNVAELVRPLPEPGKAPTVLKPEQVAPLLAVAQRHRDGPAWIVALSLGLRQSELLGLTWSDVDWERGRLHVERTVQYTKATGWLVQGTKTEPSRRTPHLPEIAIEALKRQRKRQAAERLRAETWPDSLSGLLGVDLDLVFRKPDGRPESRYDLSRRFREQVDALGLKGLEFRTLRHSAASLLRRGGVEMFEISRQLGHSKIGTTSDIYTELFEQQERKVAEAMDRALGGPAERDLHG